MTSAPAQPTRRVKTPTVLQMEAVECGAACLGIVLGYHGRFVPLEELRIACGVSRDGSKASNVVKAARAFGLKAKGFAKNAQDLPHLPLPSIVFWNFNHFVVFEGARKGRVYINDPAAGPRTVSAAEFAENFTGVVLVLVKGADFQRAGRPPSVLRALVPRLRGSLGPLCYTILASLGVLAVGLGIPTFTRVFVDEVLVAGDRSLVPGLLLGLSSAIMIRAAFIWLQQHYLLRLETKFSVSTSSTFFWHVLRLPVPFFEQRYAGEVAGRVALNDRVAQLLSGEAATAVLSAGMALLYLTLMIQYDPRLTAVSVLSAGANILALRLVARVRRDSSQLLQQERGKLLGTIMSGLASIETIKAEGNESGFFSRITGQHAKALMVEQRLSLWSMALGAVPTLLGVGTTVTILTLGAFRVVEGELTIGMLVAFLSLAMSFGEPVMRLVGLGSQLQEAAGDLRRLDDVLAYQVDPRIAAETANPSGPKLGGQLELSGVTFGYSRHEPPLIRDFCLGLKPGSRVALVGTSGSGKSTVSKLVCGLHAPWQGEIRFDGVPSAEVDRGLFNNSVALVDQDIVLFEGTIRDNLTIWDPTIPETRIVRAAKDACIHDDIAARRGGYDSLVAEDGTNFSGGQRQRLEIARALVTEPSILVLDEATSALDPVTEQRIDDSLRRRGCTCLIVAHRLSTIRDCDEIIVLDLGQVVERGTHAELLARAGTYASLVEE